MIDACMKEDGMSSGRILADPPPSSISVDASARIPFEASELKLVLSPRKVGVTMDSLHIIGQPDGPITMVKSIPTSCRHPPSIRCLSASDFLY